MVLSLMLKEAAVWVGGGLACIRGLPGDGDPQPVGKSV